MAKDHGSSVKDDKQYEGLAQEGNEKVARCPHRQQSGFGSVASGSQRSERLEPR